MSSGELAIVLHAHLPYVRSSEPGSLEEDWFFQALMECYIPLLKTIETALSANDQIPKITIGLSPTLLSLLEDNELKRRFPKWLDVRLQLLAEVSDERKEASDYLTEKIKDLIEYWVICQGDIIKRFKELQEKEVIDIMTCAATHGYLPLLRENPEAVLGQIKTAVREHIRLFGTNPLGIWLPECAYYEDLDSILQTCGIRYAVLDGHGLLHANPRPRYGLYAPICSQNGVAFFGRDSDSTLPVWSAKDGYPGDPIYREFHKDLGWDLPIERLKSIGINQPRPLGLKLHKVTSKSASLENKKLYEPHLARNRIKQHAKEYLSDRRNQLNQLKSKMDISPLLVAPFDAELFGHWWFEGPLFLSELFSQAKQAKVTFITLRDFLKRTPQLQVCEPCPSSWGQGGFHNYWLNESNDWVVLEWSKASKALIKRCSIGVSKENHLRILQQAARELLLAQSSDWSFILRAGTTTELAKERIHRHLNRFWTLMKEIDGIENLPSGFLNNVEREDCLFPLIQAKDWSKKIKS